jgi:hypothetical protein
VCGKCCVFDFVIAAAVSALAHSSIHVCVLLLLLLYAAAAVRVFRSFVSGVYCALVRSYCFQDVTVCSYTVLTYIHKQLLFFLTTRLLLLQILQTTAAVKQLHRAAHTVRKCSANCYLYRHTKSF